MQAGSGVQEQARTPTRAKKNSQNSCCVEVFGLVPTIDKKNTKLTSLRDHRRSVFDVRLPHAQRVLSTHAFELFLISASSWSWRPWSSDDCPHSVSKLTIRATNENPTKTRPFLWSLSCPLAKHTHYCTTYPEYPESRANQNSCCP